LRALIEDKSEFIPQEHPLYPVVLFIVWLSLGYYSFTVEP